MALATDLAVGEIQLTGDLSGDGGAQVGSNPQLTHMTGLTPGQYINPKMTVDAKGRTTAIVQATPSEIGGTLPVASPTVTGAVSIGENLNITPNATKGYQDIDFGGLLTTGGVQSGLDGCATYTLEILKDGSISYTVSAQGSDLSIIQDIIEEINNDTTGITASLVSGNLRITSLTEGRGSNIQVTSDTMLGCMTNYVGLSAPVAGTESCELFVKESTASELGVVKNGYGIISTDGVLSVDFSLLPMATSSTVGRVFVPSVNGLSVNGATGELSVDYATTDGLTAGVVKIGNGLDIDGNGVCTVDLTETGYQYASIDGLTAGIIKIGGGLDIDANGVCTVDLAETGYQYATDDGLAAGIIKIGNGLDVDVNGVASVNPSEIVYPKATTSQLGVMQIGSNLIDEGSGVVGVDFSGLQLADDVGGFGVVTIGSNINVTAGSISVPDATNISKGVVSIGGGLIDDGNGVVSTDPAGYTVGSKTVKGVVQIGNYMNDGGGAGIISPDLANGDTTYGIVYSGNTSNISITSGVIDVGTNIPKLNANNTFSKAQTVAPVALATTGNVSVDGTDSNVFTITLTGDATLDNPTSLLAGASYVFIIKQDGVGGHTLSYGLSYKFISGIDPTASTSANDTDVMSCISDGTNLFCSYNKDFS